MINNLFQRLVVHEFRRIEEVTILSGYASGSFLKRIVEIYPELKINLYLGMTNEGISRSSHGLFQNLTKLNPNVKVYYKINGKPNHMKLYSLYRDQKLIKTFVGSANFTENGFEYNEEILVENDLSCKELLASQLSNFLLCTDEYIDKYIHIYEREIETDNRESSSSSISRQSIFKIDELIKIKNMANFKYYKEFDLEIIKLNERNWNNSGLNGCFNHQTSHIPLGTKLLHQNPFPRDVELEFKTEEENFTAISTSKYKGALIFKNISIYEYIKQKVNLVDVRPISRYDLEQVNCTHIKFIRVDEYKYFIKFY